MGNLKKRWGVTSNFQIIIILIVFSVTGSALLYIAKPIIKQTGITIDNLLVALNWGLYILISFVTYQVMLVVIGGLFGQFNFFWRMVKK